MLIYKVASLHLGPMKTVGESGSPFWTARRSRIFAVSIGFVELSQASGAPSSTPQWYRVTDLENRFGEVVINYDLENWRDEQPYEAASDDDEDEESEAEPEQPTPSVTGRRLNPAQLSRLTQLVRQVADLTVE